MIPTDIMNMLAPDQPGDDDVLLLGPGTSDLQRSLIHWQRTTPELQDFVPDLHRLQLEHWVWTFRDRLQGKAVLDIGAQNPRRWLGEGYRTFGNTDDVTADIRGDLLNLVCSEPPTAALHGPIIHESIDAIICTEVLEHCEDPIQAVAEMYAALKPGGLLLVTSPFIWPDHRTEDYPDYWRVTEQGWELLLRDFVNVKITPMEWTSEAKALLDLVRRFEGWGFKHYIKAHTGYMAEAYKAA